MNATLENIEKELNKLVDFGEEMIQSFSEETDEENRTTLERYQEWYTPACAFIKFSISERLEDFQEMV